MDDSGGEEGRIPVSDTSHAYADWSNFPFRALISDHGTVLSDEVLLGIFFQFVGVDQEECKRLVDAVLIRFGSLAGFFFADERALHGILQRACQLIPSTILMHEAALRYNRARMGRDDILSNPKLMLNYLVSRLGREAVEQFRILFLDEKNRLIADEVQTRGTVNHTPVYPREVAKRAMELGARSIVLVHNHPSGDPTPSDADLSMTHAVQAAVALIDVRVADHIIIGNGAHISFRTSGLFPVVKNHPKAP